MQHQIMHMNARNIYAQLFFLNNGLANMVKPILLKSFKTVSLGILHCKTCLNLYFKATANFGIVSNVFIPYGL